MRILNINNFENGLLSDIDGIDIPKNGLKDIKGLRIRPGFLRSNYPPSQLSQISYTSPRSLAELKLFKTTSTTERMLIFQDSSDIRKNIYSGSYGTFASIGTFFTDKAKYSVVQKNLYIMPNGLDHTKDVKKYQYINRNYFNSAMSYYDWYFISSYLAQPSSGDYNLANVGTGSLSGKYFFRLTFEYDNYQESCWQSWGGDNQQSINATGADTIRMDIELDSSTINKRITAINIYIAWNSDTSASSPSTGWYFAGRVDINDSNWAVTTFPNYGITVTIGLSSGGASSDFPNNHYSSGFDGALDLFELELYSKTNSVIDKAYWGVEAYGDSVFSNGRLFVILPDVYHGELPYDPRQVVLFSQINKPDEIQYLVDYIDLTTDEGDRCVAIIGINYNILVLKEKSLFRINTYNSNKVLDWEISDPIKGVSCITKHSVQKIKQFVIFAGLIDIYLTDGNDYISIVKNKIQDEYIDLVNSETNYDDISSGIDHLNLAYWIFFPTSQIILKYYIEEKRWEKIDATDFHDLYMITNGIGGIPIAIDKDSTTKVVVLEDKNASGTNISNIMETGWLSIDGDPLNEKQIRWLKLIGKFNNGVINIYVYKDFDSSPEITLTINQTTDRIIFKEISMIAKVLKIKISTGSTNSSGNIFELQNIEVAYEGLGNR